MTENNEKLNRIQERLESLLKRQDEFSREIRSLQIELDRLKTAEPEPVEVREEVRQFAPVVEAEVCISYQETISETGSVSLREEPETAGQTEIPELKQSILKSSLERFIGENLINKIGIIITVIGVGIGAKYSIDNNLISPLTRIILGYLFGLGLLGFGIRLKSRYENYSAVLVSGAMAIMYFITYLAYDLYQLLPQLVAFGVMLLFTVFTVIAAINYNKQVIAHIGLVGAYAVPFLLSEGSGKVAVLFSYMAIINIGILAISVKRYWKPLFYSSFGLTWIIFMSWYSSKYQASTDMGLAMGFLSLFFVLFYLTFLAYKLIQKENFTYDGIVLIITNSLIFYGIGYAIFKDHKTTSQFLGLFTLLNAIIHFVVSVIIYRQKLADKNVQYLVTGLVMIFITMAVPVQLNGNWVTLLWAGEAALLFWIGRSRQVFFYEMLSYPLMVLAFFSLVQDWGSAYYGFTYAKSKTNLIPLLNLHFLSSILFIVAFGFMHKINRNRNYFSEVVSEYGISDKLSGIIQTVFLFTLYASFRLEIVHYWYQLYNDSVITVKSVNNQSPTQFWNHDLKEFKTIWVLNYSLLFFSILSWVNMKKFRNQQLGFVSLVLMTLTLIIFLFQGLYVLSELRESYLQQTLSKYYRIGSFNIVIRYISLAFAALALGTCYKTTRQDFIKINLKIPFEILMHTSLLWIVSSEWIHWMDMANSTQSYKLGLSILWGLYSLFLIAFGIWKKNQPLRIGAFVLFGITLVKLFFYDISHLNTIAKTIVFVTLGVLLLISSFLYNKYKHLVSDNEPEN